MEQLGQNLSYFVPAVVALCAQMLSLCCDQPAVLALAKKIKFCDILTDLIRKPCKHYCVSWYSLARVNAFFYVLFHYFLVKGSKVIAILVNLPAFTLCSP